MIAANHLRGDHPLARWKELLDTHVRVVKYHDEAGQLLELILVNPFAQAQIMMYERLPSFIKSISFKR